MKVLITGAAGNLGSSLARHLLDSSLELRLLTHRKEMPFDVTPYKNASVCKADLGDPASLNDVCADVDCVVHFAGVLFAPRPEEFLWRTNVGYVRNLVAAALATGVHRFILISFPHVEGESFPERPATDRLDVTPASVHARTRLAAEQHLFEACRGTLTTPVSLRAGMVYAAAS
jgi:nucleoside-diphosphate-sugar epimerase